MPFEPEPVRTEGVRQEQAGAGLGERAMDLLDERGLGDVEELEAGVDLRAEGDQRRPEAPVGDDRTLCEQLAEPRPVHDRSVPPPPPRIPRTGRGRAA